MSYSHVQTWTGSYGTPFPPHLHPQPWDGSYGTPFNPLHPHHGTQVNSSYPQTPFHFNPPNITINLGYPSLPIDSTTPIHHAGNLINTHLTYDSSRPLVASPEAMTPAGCSTGFSPTPVRPRSQSFRSMVPEKPFIHRLLGPWENRARLDFWAPEFSAEYRNGRSISVTDLGTPATYPATEEVVIKAVNQHRDLVFSFSIKSESSQPVTVGQVLECVYRGMQAMPKFAMIYQFSRLESAYRMRQYAEGNSIVDDYYWRNIDWGNVHRGKIDWRQMGWKNIDYFGGNHMFDGFQMDREGVFHLLVGPLALARSE